MIEDCLLSVRNLSCGYGKKRVVNGISIEVGCGEIVALIGHNGAGKSTVLKSIFGLIPMWDGEVWIKGGLFPSPTPRMLLHAGVSYSPQGNRVFTDLTVQENLAMAATTLGSSQTVKRRIDYVLGLFPALGPRLDHRAGTLSGGEKQMLALANALVIMPVLLLLDEPSLGLAPQLVSSSLKRVKEICVESGAGALIVEQKVREVLSIAQRVYVLRNGLVSFSGPVESIKGEANLREVYL